MMILMHLVSVLALASSSPQGDELSDIARQSVAYVLQRTSEPVRLASKIEVQADGAFDRDRSNAVATALGVEAAQKANAVQCTTESGKRSCQIVGGEYFVMINQSGKAAGNRKTVTVETVNVVQGRLHVTSMSLELVKSANGWSVTRVLQAGES